LLRQVLFARAILLAMEAIGLWPLAVKQSKPVALICCFLKAVNALILAMIRLQK
jgi:hypothetical protein